MGARVPDFVNYHSHSSCPGQAHHARQVGGKQDGFGGDAKAPGFPPGKEEWDAICPEDHESVGVCCILAKSEQYRKQLVSAFSRVIPPRRILKARHPGECVRPGKFNSVKSTLLFSDATATSRIIIREVVNVGLHHYYGYRPTYFQIETFRALRNHPYRLYSNFRITPSFRMIRCFGSRTGQSSAFK